ncbi:MAG: hypothetical protein REI94_03565 [Moraxellaceae bacterium]|nr:hypothetical protein [Moraxellaceae bacterium]
MDGATVGRLVSGLCGAVLALGLAVWWHGTSALVLLAVVSAGLALGGRLSWPSGRRWPGFANVAWYAFHALLAAWALGEGLRTLRLNAAESMMAIGRLPVDAGLHAVAQWIGNQPSFLYLLILLGICELLAALARRSFAAKAFLKAALAHAAAWMAIILLPAFLAHALAGRLDTGEQDWMNPAYNLSLVVAPYHAPSTLVTSLSRDVGPVAGQRTGRLTYRTKSFEGFMEGVLPWMLLCAVLAVVGAWRAGGHSPGVRGLLLGPLVPGSLHPLSSSLRRLPWRGRLLFAGVACVLLAVAVAAVLHALLFATILFVMYGVWLLPFVALPLGLAYALWRRVRRSRAPREPG